MNNMIEFLYLPFTYLFMQKAFLAVILVAIPTAIFSCLIVLKAEPLVSKAISHAVMPGIVLAHIFALPYIIGAFISGIVCTFLCKFIIRKSKNNKDAVLVCIYSTMFAIGMLLISRVDSKLCLEQILFGDLLAVTKSDLVEMLIVLIIVLIFIKLVKKHIVLFIFNPDHAEIIGNGTKLLYFSRLMILCLCIVGALKVMGTILIIAMLIIPGAISRILSDQFNEMLQYSVLISVFSSIFGVYISFFIDSAPAPTIIVLQTILFLSAIGFNKKSSS